MPSYERDSPHEGLHRPHMNATLLQESLGRHHMKAVLPHERPYPTCAPHSHSRTRSPPLERNTPTWEAQPPHMNTTHTQESPKRTHMNNGSHMRTK